jgi:2-polyprenyl-6-methoxyphenol hydroxylase-like FAD-dependent oxidoreductase
VRAAAALRAPSRWPLGPARRWPWPAPACSPTRWRTGRAGSWDAFAAYEARLRPWAEAAQRMARRNVHLFTPPSRFQLVAREAVLRLAALPFLAPLSSGY